MFIIRKIGYGSNVSIVYEYSHGKGSPERMQIDSPQLPRTAFIYAMNALRLHGMFACDIPEEYQSGLSLHSVQWTKNGVRFEMRKRLQSPAKGIVHIKSPEIELYSTLAKKQKHSLPQEATSLLNSLREAAIGYINGERGNGPMFDDQPEPEDGK